MTVYHPTYDLFRTKEAAERDASRRSKAAKANGSGRRYVVRLHSSKAGVRLYTVKYHQGRATR